MSIFQRLQSLATSISIYLIPMKNTPANLSRSQLLAWVNSHVEKTIGPVKRIEELGTGVGYLLLVDSLRPGSIKVEKMIKYPLNHHEYFHNLRMVVAAFERLNVIIPIDMERIPMMKFQENYALACAIKKALDPDTAKQPLTRSEKENKNQTNKVPIHQRIKVVKVAPEKRVTPPVVEERKKEVEEEEDIAKDLEKLFSPQRKLKKIEAVVMEEDVAYREKLDKIAKILNLKRPETNHYSSNNNNSLRPLTIEHSYQRFLRPSLCEKSSFFPKKTISFGKTEKMDIVSQGQNLSMSKGRESDGENLLSQIKKDNFEKEEEKMDIVFFEPGKTGTEGNELKEDDALLSNKKEREANQQEQPLELDQNFQQSIPSIGNGQQGEEGETSLLSQLLV